LARLASGLKGPVAGAAAGATSAGAARAPRAPPATAASPGHLADITAAWAIAHGLALLVIDGRLRPLTDEAGVDALVSAALSRLSLQRSGAA